MLLHHAVLVGFCIIILFMLTWEIICCEYKKSLDCTVQVKALEDAKVQN